MLTISGQGPCIPLAGTTIPLTITSLNIILHRELANGNKFSHKILKHRYDEGHFLLYNYFMAPNSDFREEHLDHLPSVTNCKYSRASMA